jgi:drug/metabolite transporter (DMT)-like permease
MSNTARGLAWLIPFVVLVAGTDVYAGHTVQSLNPVTVGAVSFTFAALLFIGINAGRSGVASSFRPWRTNRSDVVMFNVMTALTWLTLLFSLKFLEPAVVSVVTFAIGPAIMVVIGPLLRRSSATLATELVVSVLILGLIGALSWGSVDGLSGIGKIGTERAIVGLTLAVICGGAYVGTIVYSKRLSDAGLTPLSTLALRYPLMVVVSWILVGFSSHPDILPALLPGAGFALIGVALQNYIGQVGIKYVEPITASLLDTLSPLVAYMLQFLDGRLHPTAFTLTCILAITALVGLGVLARSRYESRLPATVVPLPIGEEDSATESAA